MSFNISCRIDLIHDTIFARALELMGQKQCCTVSQGAKNLPVQEIAVDFVYSVHQKMKNF